MHKKHTIGWVLTAALLMGVIASLPITDTIIPRSGLQVLGIFSGTLLLWLTVAIDWPSLLCLALLGMVPAVGMNRVLTLAFGNELFAFLLFTFLCTDVLAQTSILTRIAQALMKSRFAQRGPWHFYTMFLSAVYLVGLFVSPTVLFVVFLPIFEKLCALVGWSKGHRSAQCLMLSMIVTIALSAAATPIGHVFAVTAIGAYQQATNQIIAYTAYIGMALPITLVLFGILWATMKWVYRPDMSALIQAARTQQWQESVQRMESYERWVACVFFGVVGLWLAPTGLQSLWPEGARSLTAYGTAFPPLVGVILLACRTNRHAPSWSLAQALARGVHWPSLLLVAATLTLGAVFKMDDIGLVSVLQHYLAPWLAQLPSWLVVCVVVAWAGVQTNFSSNLVTVSVVCAVVIPVVQSFATPSVHLAALCCLIGFMASLAFASPPAMPYVAIAVGSGWVRARTALCYGLWLLWWSIVVATALGYPLGTLLLP